MRMTRVEAILTAPDGLALVVVKVESDQPGLYGLGCTTFTGRPTLVAAAVGDYRHADGRDPQEVLENGVRYREEGAQWKRKRQRKDDTKTGGLLEAARLFC
jgi:mannonate dehydratase